MKENSPKPSGVHHDHHCLYLVLIFAASMVVCCGITLMPPWFILAVWGVVLVGVFVMASSQS